MKKLLTIIAALIMCNAYGATEEVFWMQNEDTVSKTSCTTNGNITTPPIPQKTGFRFIGWKELATPQNYKEMLGFTFTSVYPSSYSTAKSWSAYTSYGDVSGTSMCSSSYGYCGGGTDCPKMTTTPATSGTSSQNVYCWCHRTSVNFNNKTTGFSDSIWVAKSYGTTNATTCNRDCSYYCAQAAKDYTEFRFRLFNMI